MTVTLPARAALTLIPPWAPPGTPVSGLALAAALGRSLARSLAPWGRRGRRDDHRRAVPQPVGPIGHHFLATLQSRRDRHEAAVSRPDLHRAHRDRVVGIDDINVGAGLAAWHRRDRNANRIL